MNKIKKILRFLDLKNEYYVSVSDKLDDSHEYFLHEYYAGMHKIQFFSKKEDIEKYVSDLKQKDFIFDAKAYKINDFSEVKII